MFNTRKYEAVAMLDLPQQEREQIEKRAEQMINGFGSLEKIDATETPPLITVLDIHTVLRDDVSEKLLLRDEIMSNAPEQHDGYFQVPGTLE